MKLELQLISLIFISIQVTTVIADVSIGIYADPNHPGKCVLQNLVLPPGEVAKHPEMCAKITCHENSKASVVTCAMMVPPPGCTVGSPMNPDANYPNCCRMKIICDNGLTFSS